jgi:hypothetical protein
VTPFASVLVTAIDLAVPVPVIVVPAGRFEHSPEDKRHGERLHIRPAVRRRGGRDTENERPDRDEHQSQPLHLSLPSLGAKGDATRGVLEPLCVPSRQRLACAAFLARALAWDREQGVIVERVLTDNARAYRSRRKTSKCHWKKPLSSLVLSS